MTWKPISGLGDAGGRAMSWRTASEWERIAVSWPSMRCSKSASSGGGRGEARARSAAPTFLKLSLDLLGITSRGADCPTNKNPNIEMIMKLIMPWMIGTVTLCAAATLALGADEALPGQVDFGTLSPPKGEGEFVEVNVPTGLITLAARLVEKEQPEVAKLLNSIKLVRVTVIGLEAENRAALQQRAKKIREDLAGKGWERIVTAQEKDQDVSVYLKMADKGAVQGLAAVVIDGKEHAVFANVVGDIKPEQLAMLGDKLHIDPLKQIGNTAQKPENKPKEKAEE